MKISNILLEWYKKYARDLPWRQTRDPYNIWISEIILQQTQVSQGTDYYLRFIRNFPDVNTLSAAEEDEVLKLWQGLGYYSRARNLLKAAKQVSAGYNGELPDNFRQLKTLSGIGDYTAAAIASIAFNEPVAVVDGNVSRVLSRLFGVDIPINSSEGKKVIQKLASEILDKEFPGNSNQALMEFGALLCRPVNPGCETCPLSAHCKAFSDGTMHKLPLKITRKSTKVRWFNYFLINHEKNLFIQKRVHNDIWKSLFQFPLLETNNEEQADKILDAFLNKEMPGLQNYTVSSISKSFTHLLTHQTIKAKFFNIELRENYRTMPADWQKTDRAEIDNYPIPRLIEKYLESL